MVKLNTVGKFECVVTDPTEKNESGHPNWFAESKTNPGNYSLAIPLIVTSGQCEGQEITAFLPLTDTIIEKTGISVFDTNIARMIDVFGTGDIAALNAGRITLVGLPCGIETELKTFNGKQSLAVKWLNRPGSGGIKAPDKAKLDSMLKRLGPRASAMTKSIAGTSTPAAPTRTPTRSTRPATPTPAAAPIAGDGPPEADDIPF